MSQGLRETILRRAKAKKEAIDQYKVDKGCVDCGYNKSPYALEFDHLPGTIKNNTVASLMYGGWKTIWAEIKKCEVVCANCHAIRTHKRRQASLSQLVEETVLETV